MKTVDFLAEIIRKNDLKDRYGNTGTTYSVWKHMHAKYGWTIATVSNYFKGATLPGDQQALEIAAELELEPAYVVVCIEAERTKNPYVKAALEDAAERLKAPAKKAATRRAPSKTARVAGVILSLGLITGITGASVRLEQLPEISGVYQLADYQASEAGIEQCVLCQIVDSLLRAPHLPLASFLLLLSVITYRLAHDRGLLRSNNNKNNNKKNASGGLSHDGRDAELLPAPSRIVTTAGRNIVRLFPENLPARRGSTDTAGRRARVIEISRRLHPRLGGLSHPGRSADHTGRHPTASQHLGGMELCTAITRGPDPCITKQGISAREPAAEKSIAAIPRSAFYRTAGTAPASVSSTRSVSATCAPGAPSKRPAARRAFVKAAALAMLGFAGNAAAAPAITLGLISEHHATTTQYDETNPGLCLESGFTWYVTGCLYEDSQSQPAGVLAAGGRISISDWFHIGAGFGLQFRQALNKAGEETIDPDPVIAGTATIGTERLAAQLIRTPEHDTKHNTIPAVTWLQVRFGF